MKRTLLTLLTLTALVSACKKETYRPIDTVNCTTDYSTHPRHQEFQAILDEYAKNGITGLTVILSSPEDGYWEGSAGYASIEDNIPMTPCHLHHTASMAKSFTGVVTLQLIDEGKLALDSPVADYIDHAFHSYIPNLEQLTVKHLLQQTSGIPEVFDLPFFETLMNDPEATYTNEDFIRMIEGMPAMFAPDAQHFYSDLNYTLLILIINRIEGDHKKAFQERIFTPLGLNDMYYHNGAYPEPEGLVSSYWDQYNNGQIENVSELQIRMTQYIEGSDGIISSAADMFKFYEAVFNGELTSSDHLVMLLTDWVAETDENRMNTGYSHGFMTVSEDDGNWIGHAGSHIGSSCYVFQNTTTKETIGVFTNTGVHFFLEKKGLIYYYLWNDLRKAL